MAGDIILRRQPEEEPEHYPQFSFFCHPERVEEARALLSQIPGLQLKEQSQQQILQTIYAVRGYGSEETFAAVLSALSDAKIAGYSRASQVFLQKEKANKTYVHAAPDKPQVESFGE